MTTGGLGSGPPPAPEHGVRLPLWSVGVGLAAVLVGVQSLAASTPFPQEVLMLLPSEGLLAGVGDGLRRGYGLAMEETRACAPQARHWAGFRRRRIQRPCCSASRCRSC